MSYSWPSLPVLIVCSGIILDLGKEEPGDCQFLKGKVVRLLLWRITHLQNSKRGGERKEAAWGARARHRTVVASGVGYPASSLKFAKISMMQ